MLRFLFLLNFAFLFSEAIRCRSCYSYNGQACVNAPDCESDVCLYEQLNAANGITHVLRTCYTKGKAYQFDDGVTMSNLNQCVTRTTRQGQYYVALCTTQDMCNNDCKTQTQPTLPPVNPTPLLGSVTCYECSTNDGTDCQTNTCEGAYCLYERRLFNNQMYLRKSCLIEPTIQLDDETTVASVGLCEVRNTVNSRYFVKICNDVNLCNNYCNPGQTPPIPQRQPLVRCYDCESSDSDCFTGSCEGNFCIFERQLRVGTTKTYYRKSCSALAYAQYPDGTYTGVPNVCNFRVINDVEYNVKVCNTGNLCNSQCTQDTSAVTCTECSAVNSDDCSGGTCQGRFCTFVRSKNQLDPTKSTVKKSCATTSILSFPDNSAYTNINHCQYKMAGSIQTAIKACNTSFCNTACSDIPLPTPAPQNSVSSKVCNAEILITLLLLVLAV
ncbi:UPAR/Ly6 domain-containing protein [Caenorhabditis elegans]|uniref:UPAR/Ly6 domain-containing protein n=1 Tax=Caenorhabditis elegans TaxID=6239 RepID=P90769_CAEEL|nr:UPAR/Ly6 domain-containing protein [Caenorhabditis elegans]CAB05700.2 UPAR/Ly6 domain-containing protein [Caenorhabditis elegans]|eukprot:NP_492264.1 Uncharacterized protein CELE_C34B7.1 [Caenorhabditis elegans]